MSQESVVAVYDSFAKAKDAVQLLDDADFPADQISFVTHSLEDEVVDEEALQHGDRAETSAAKGAGMGGLIGMLLGTPLMAVSGVGAVLIAGPIATGLAGAIVGGFLGAMGGWGVHEDHIRRYEKKIADGALLVIVNGDPQDAAQAKEILQQTETEELHLHAETSADAVEP